MEVESWRYGLTLALIHKQCSALLWEEVEKLREVADEEDAGVADASASD
jgi:hypothetical protein